MASIGPAPPIWTFSFFLERIRAASAAAPIYEIGDHDRRRFITMEYQEGETLKHLVSLRPEELEGC
jgi:hypothetical protein